jgi:hypothetical protein
MNFLQILSERISQHTVDIKVEDPHHFNANPDPSFHFNADPDLTFHFHADPNTDPAPHQSDENLQPQTVQGSILGLHASFAGVHRPPRFHFEPLI